MTYLTNPTIAQIGHPSTRNSLARLRARLQTVLQRRADRAAYRQMLDLDDHLLRDIGVTRDQVARAAHAPLAEGIELSRRASCTR